VTCTGCTTALPKKGLKEMVFDCKPAGWVSPGGCPDGWAESIVLAFCSFTCAIAYCESRCPCGGTCWKGYDVGPLLARLAAAEARAGVTT